MSDARSGQNHLAVPHSVFEDAAQSAALLSILCLMSVRLMSELFLLSFLIVMWHYSVYSNWN